MLSAMMLMFMTSRMLTTSARTLQTKKTKTTTMSIVARPISFFCSRVSRARSELARRTCVTATHYHWVDGKDERRRLKGPKAQRPKVQKAQRPKGQKAKRPKGLKTQRPKGRAPVGSVDAKGHFPDRHMYDLLKSRTPLKASSQDFIRMEKGRCNFAAQLRSLRQILKKIKFWHCIGSLQNLGY